jgi:hypothetical protein
MHHCVILQDGGNTPAHALVAYAADALLADYNSSISSPLATRRTVTKEEEGFAGYESGFAQASNDACLVDYTVGAAHAAAEVRFEL